MSFRMAVEHLLKTGKTPKEIKAVIPVDGSYICQLRKNLGLPKFKRGRPKGTKVGFSKLNQKRREIASKLKNSGHTYLQIGKQMGISRQRVQQILRSMEWKPNAELSKNACSNCGKKNTQLHYHHLHYPEQTILLCTRCHRLQHVLFERNAYRT